MSLESLKMAALPRALSDVVSDLADLIQKELRLAKAEVIDKVSTRLEAAVWMAAAGFLGLLVLMLVAQAAVFGIAAQGIAMHWACLMVAGVAGLIAAALFLKGQNDAKENFSPERTIHQIKKDIRTAKEQLT